MDKTIKQVEESSIPLSENWCRIEKMAMSVKRGDYSSLVYLRNRLNISQAEVAAKMDIPPRILVGWEKGRVQPTIYQMARWRVILSGYIDEKIKSYLDIDSMETVNQFWELIWELNE